MDLISIVVPIYNLEKYIERCVESIRNQSYSKLEIILVNDGSKDDSGRICDTIAQKDERVKVIHKINGGLSDARNTGIEAAKGKYIGFIDGDDYIDHDMFETLYHEIIQKQADIASCGYYEEFTDKKIVLCCSDTTVVLNRKEAYRALFDRKPILGCSSCNKLFRKTLFDKERYTVGIQGEDLDLIYRIISHANNIVCVNAVKYHYVHRAGSITTSGFNPRYMDIIETSLKIIDYIEENYPELLLQAYAYQSMWLVGGVHQIENSANKEKFITEAGIIYNIVRERFKFFRRNKYIPKWEYILLWAMKLDIYIMTQRLLDTLAKIYHIIWRK